MYYSCNSSLSFLLVLPDEGNSANFPPLLDINQGSNLVDQFTYGWKLRQECRLCYSIAYYLMIFAAEELRMAQLGRKKAQLAYSSMLQFRISFLRYKVDFRERLSFSTCCCLQDLGLDYQMEDLLQRESSKNLTTMQYSPFSQISQYPSS